VRRVLAFVLVGACAGSGAGVEPARGRTSGGDLVRIEGEGFTQHGPPVVYFGPKAAKAVVVESGTLITVLSPQADAEGVVDVEIHFDDGTVVQHAGAFTYHEEALVLRPD
jgi:hypothetical protein